MVRYQLTGLQCRAAKSQRLAHKQKTEMDTTAADVRDREVGGEGESKADLYNNILQNWTATQLAQFIKWNV